METQIRAEKFDRCQNSLSCVTINIDATSHRMVIRSKISVSLD